MKKCSEMNYHSGVVLKIYPSDAQKHTIAVNDGAQRAVYNLLVGVDKEAHRLKKQLILSLLTESVLKMLRLRSVN
jgi:putative transposase